MSEAWKSLLLTEVYYMDRRNWSQRVIGRMGWVVAWIVREKKGGSRTHPAGAAALPDGRGSDARSGAEEVGDHAGDVGHVKESIVAEVAVTDVMGSMELASTEFATVVQTFGSKRRIPKLGIMVL